MTREELEEKIMQAKEEMKTAGPVHRRDLRKHMKRMQDELRQYDRYRREAEAE